MTTSRGIVTKESLASLLSCDNDAMIKEFSYVALRVVSRSRWVICRTFSDISHIELPMADRTLLLVDNRLPNKGVRVIEAMLTRERRAVTTRSYNTSSKGIPLLDSIARDLLEEKSGLLCVAGGGTLCDVGTLAASLANPPLRTVLFPSTVIAMCDASVGGLTGLDRWGVKGVWGTRHPPLLSVSCVEWLDTLPEEHYLSGFAEIVKMLFLAVEGEPDLAWMSSYSQDIRNHVPEAVLDVLATGARLRSQWVRKAKRSGRDLFGHNVGHALELLSGVPHGEAVAQGMLLEASIAVQLQILKEATFSKLRSSLVELSLPRTVRAASKSRDHGWVVRRHAETGVFVSGMVDIVGGWGGCDGCGGQADLRG